MKVLFALICHGALVFLTDAWTISTHDQCSFHPVAKKRSLYNCRNAAFSLSRGIQPSNRCSTLFSSNDDYAELSSGSWKPGRPPLRRPIRSANARRKEDIVAGRLNESSETTEAPSLTPHEQAMQDPNLLSSTNVTELIQSPLLLRSLREMGIHQLTRVQQQTYGSIRQGKTLCARSKTGSGKTLAFLLPILDHLLLSSAGTVKSVGAEFYTNVNSKLLPAPETSVLILVPTRELGLQITEQIKSLLVHRPGALTVLSLSGGTTSLGMDRRNLAKTKHLPDVIVATPGRLLDLITDRPGGGTTRVRGRKFSDILGGTKIVALDEADRLLVDGFQKETMRILSVLPRAEKRQTLLFSATIPDKMKELMVNMLPQDTVHVDCVEDGDSADRINRFYLQIPSMDCYTSSLVLILRQEVQKNTDHHKILVFMPTAKLVRFYADLFNDGLGCPVLEIHSRMSQSARNKARAAFTRAERSIMFTSDVSARGIDYPDVSLVIQFGSPFNANLNTHRIGRTARAGREGEALLVTLPFETKSSSSFARKLGYKRKRSDYDFGDCQEVSLRVRSLVSKNRGLRANAESAYVSFIAYYAEYGPKFLDSSSLLQAAEMLVAELGLRQTELPELPERLKQSLDEMSL